MIKVSIIIPAYNVEKYISKCIDSIIKENISKEIIIINDGSTDNTLKILNTYKSKYKNVIIINQKNQGQGKARNEGIKQAKGKYLCFIDSDDWINQNSIVNAYNIMENKKLDILYWNINWIHENNNVKCQNIFSKVYDKLDLVGYLLSDPSPCNKMFKKEMFDKNNLFFPTDCIYEDFAFIPGLVKYTDKIMYTDKICYNYFQHNNSTMNQCNYNPKLMDLIISYDHLYNNLKGIYDKELEYLAINQLIYFRTMELLKYRKYDEINSCYNYVKTIFPYWNKNIYFLKKPLIIRIYCILISKKKYLLCNQIYLLKKFISK